MNNDTYSFNTVHIFIIIYQVLTDKLEGDEYITLHMIWPTVFKISDLLKQNDDDFISEIEDTNSIVSDMKHIGVTYFSKNAKDIEPTMEHKFMTFLTPTMKKLKFIDSRSRFQLHCEIEDHIKNHFEDNGATQIMPNVSSTEEVEQTDQNSNIFEDYVSFDVDSTNDSEVEQYLQHPVLQEVDATAWWITNKLKYPNLYKMFKALSCIPATSASSERDFSVAGNIITDKRSMLLPENVNDLIVARNILS